MRYRAVFYLLGRLLFIIGGILAIPAAVSYYYGESQNYLNFLLTAAASILTGLLLAWTCRKARDEGVGVREGFLLVTLSWLLISLFGAIPFCLSPYFPSVVDGIFESISGFTTTGASILVDIEAVPKGLLFWRNFTQWIGGMGIVVFAIAVLPQLSVGGMQLMKNEMPGPTFEQLKPRIKQTAISLWKIYVLFSVLQVAVLCLLGMPLFESICNMFGTMSTGGFSPRSLSIAAYGPAIQYAITFFMFFAGANFVLHYTNLHGNFRKMIQDNEWRFYTTMTVVATLLIAVDLVLQSTPTAVDAFRLGIFQVISVMTTTGFVTDDFDKWPHLSKGLLFLLMFVGGCAGSTAGGMKQIRLMLLFKKARQSIMQHIHPKAVISIKVDRKAVPEHVLDGVSSFFLIYLVIFSFGTLALLAFNIDFVTATSAVVATLSNVGPGFGGVGAVKNYAGFPDLVKLVLSALMIIGRLEIFTVLVLFFPAAWRR